MRPRALVAPVGAAIFSLLALKYAPLPYLWAGLAWGTALIVLMRASTRVALQILWLNLAVVVLLAAGCEAFAAYAMRSQPTVPVVSEGYRVRDDVLGSSPPGGAIGHARLVARDGVVVYDVQYSTGVDGLRVSPPSVETPKGVVAFFGCSFTFGEGLRDQEAMPYRVGVLTGGNYRTRNFGFTGYGAHQMLSALEHGRVDEVLGSETPTHIIYQALADHAPRAGGRYSWTHYHPRYVLTGEGSVVQKGHFSDDDTPPTELEARLRRQLAKSSFVNWATARVRPVTNDDVRLWVAIVDKSRRLLQQKFPDAEFHVLLWGWVGESTPEEDRLYQEMVRALKDSGIVVHEVSAILPGYAQDPRPFGLMWPYDDHPSAKTNNLLARYVVEHILERPAETRAGLLAPPTP